MEISAPGILVEFVHFKAGCVGRRRMIHLAGKRCTEAVDAPAPIRKFAIEHSVGTHFSGQHQHIPLGRIGILLYHGRIKAVKIVAIRETGLLFHMLQACNRKQL